MSGDVPMQKKRGRMTTPVVVMLLLPYVGLCFPGVYARVTPALLGFPFFYWYQFAWVVLTSALLLAVYKRLKR